MACIPITYAPSVPTYSPTLIIPINLLLYFIVGIVGNSAQKAGLIFG